MNKKCVIIGQTGVKLTVRKVKKLFSTVEGLVGKEPVEFYFGRDCIFMRVAYRFVNHFKSKNNEIRRIYVSPFENQRQVVNYDDYEEIFVPQQTSRIKKKAYEYANKEVIDLCDVVICYFCPSSKNEESKLAYDYALSKGKQVFNVYTVDTLF